MSAPVLLPVGASKSRARTTRKVPVSELRPDDFVGVAQAAEYLQVSDWLMRRLISRGKVRHLEVTEGHFRMRVRWLEEYVEAEAKGGLS